MTLHTSTGPKRQVFDDPSGRRERVLRGVLQYLTTALLALAVLLLHALLLAPWPGADDERSAHPELPAPAVLLPVHAESAVNARWLAMLRAQGRHAAFVVAGKEALKEPAAIEALVAQGHNVIAATFSGRSGAELAPWQLDAELSATQLALAATAGVEADRALCVPTDLSKDAAARGVRCATIDAAQLDALEQLRQAPADKAPAALAAQLAQPSAAAPANAPSAMHPAALSRKALGSVLRVTLAATDATLRAALVAALLLVALFFVRFVVVSTLTLARARRKRHQPAPLTAADLPPVTVIVPAYNEEAVIAATVRSLLACEYPSPVQIIVVDDGSADGTSAVVRTAFGSHPQVRLLTKANGGKCSALNLGIAEASTEIVVCIDADTQLDAAALRLLCRHFDDPGVAAVAGNPKVGNRRNLLTRLQALEYVVLNSVERQATEAHNAIVCISGALGAYRREILLEIGGYPSDTLAEDTDATLAILRRGGRIVYEDKAVAWTEAPETMRDFMKQRLRWTYGTAQAAFKHRRALFDTRLGSFGTIALPYLLLVNVVAGVVLQPLVDLVALVGLSHFLGGWLRWLLPDTYALLAALDRYDVALVAYSTGLGLAGLAMSAIALGLDGRERVRRVIWLLPLQVCFRVLLGITTYRCLARAACGRALGWGSLQRTGHVALPTAQAALRTALPVIAGLLIAGGLAAPGAAQAREADIVLYTPRSAAGAADGYAHWREMLAAAKRPWREIRDARVLRASAPAIVVVPQPLRLSPLELGTLQALQSSGTALLASGRLGPDDRSARDAGQRLFGITLQRLPQSLHYHVSTIGLTPLAQTLPAGTRMLLTDQPGWTALPGHGTWLPAADFTDWSYRPIVGDTPLAAVAYGTHGGARWVYYGFEDPALPSDKRENVARLTLSALRWLAAGPPATRLADWPPGYHSAQLVEMDTELDDRKDVRELDRATDLADMLAAVGAHASFYCVVGDLALAPVVLDRLHAGGHELGFHGDRHDPFGGQPPALQAQRIAAMQALWRRLRPDASGGGFRAPYESYDAATESALADSGIVYHLADVNASPARLPHFAAAGDGSRLLRLARTQPDDENFHGEARTADDSRRLLHIDADVAARQGALGLLSLHPHNFAPGAPVRQALPSVLAHLTRAGSSVWLATGGEINRWWRERARVQVQPLVDGVRIEVAPGPPLAAVSIVVDADVRRSALRIDGPAGTPLVQALAWPQLDAPPWQSELRLHDLPAGVSEVHWSSR